MNELNNRISAQRQALRIVNQFNYQEPLMGMTSKAIERWQFVNNLDAKDKLVSKVWALSATVFALSNKSQESVTEEYMLQSSKVNLLIDELQEEVNQLKN